MEGNIVSVCDAAEAMGCALCPPSFSAHLATAAAQLHVGLVHDPLVPGRHALAGDLQDVEVACHGLGVE
jgi:hypothetical protein